MRVLKFVVDDLGLRPDPSCDFSGLSPGTKTQIHAQFTFSPEWKSRVKVVAFWSMMGSEYPPQVLKDGQSCMIPTEALKRAAFKVQILGRYNGQIASTNKLIVSLKGGIT